MLSLSFDLPYHLCVICCFALCTSKYLNDSHCCNDYLKLAPAALIHVVNYP